MSYTMEPDDPNIKNPLELTWSNIIPVGRPATSRLSRFSVPGTFSFNGTSIIKIPISAKGWLDLQNGTLDFKLTNATKDNALANNLDVYLDSSAHSVIYSLQVLGPDDQILEDIQHYDKLVALLSDNQLNPQYRGTVGNMLAGYSKSAISFGSIGRLLTIRVTGANALEVNGVVVAIGANGAGGNAGNGFNFTGNATAGSFTIGGQLLVCGAGAAAGTAASVVVNGVTFACTATANTLFINGVALDLGAGGDVITVPFIVGATVQLSATSQYHPLSNSEIITAGSSKSFSLSLVSGFMQANKYLPAYYFENGALTLQIQLNNPNNVLYTPNIANSVIDYTVSDVRFTCPVIQFNNSEFYQKFKQMLDMGGIRWHAGCYQANTGDYLANQNNYSFPIGSKFRSVKSMYCQFLASGRAKNVPKTSVRATPFQGAGSCDYQFRIGSTLYPQVAVKSALNEYSNIMAENLKSFALLNSTRAQSCIDSANFFDGCYCICQDFESYPSNSMQLESGLSTSGSNLQQDLYITSSNGFAANGQFICHVLHDVIYQMLPDGRIVKAT